MASEATPAGLRAIAAEPDPHRRALRLAALVQVVGRGQRALAGPLADFLSDRDRFVRALACRALGRLGGEVARAALLHALADADAHVREAAWQALDPADDELAIPVLAAALAAGGPVPRAQALHALREIATRAGGPVALPADAIAAAAADPDKFVRAAAARLGAWLLDRARAHSIVLGALADDDAWVRESAARGAGEAFGRADKKVRAALVDALAFAREDATRLGLLRALARLAQEPAPEDAGMVGLARALLASADDGVRAAALLLLGVIAREPDPGLCADLAARLSDARAEIQAGAARLLGDLAPAGSGSLLPALTEAARSADANVRRSVAAAARRIGTRAAEPLLRRLATDSDLQVAAAAASALSELLGNP
ncbi:MAG TPA: HEAT repeat domain-containing protein [Polyangia bacterium]|nr:HEAT repeat domain-containing protein [Polyangia bacterium]